MHQRQASIPGQAKVSNFEAASLCPLAYHKNVGRFEVTVESPSLVHGIDAPQQLPYQRPGQVGSMALFERQVRFLAGPGLCCSLVCISVRICLTALVKTAHRQDHLPRMLCRDS